jgi:hypothetical protein
MGIPVLKNLRLRARLLLAFATAIVLEALVAAFDVHGVSRLDGHRRRAGRVLILVDIEELVR